MIEKPVSCIMNTDTGVYGTANKTLDYAMTNAAVGTIIVIDHSTGKTLNLSDTITNHPNGVRIYQKLKDGKIAKLSSQKPLRAGDLHYVGRTNVKEDVNFYAKLSGYTYCCDEEYGMTFEIRNDELFMQQFKNLYKESYIVPANKCCSYCNGQMETDPAMITEALYNAWKANENNSLLIAEMILDTNIQICDYNGGSPLFLKKDGTLTDITASDEITAFATAFGYDLANVTADIEIEEGTILTAAQIQAIIDYNKWMEDDDSKATTAIIFHVEPTKMYDYGQMNFKYVKNRATRMSAYKEGGFKCSGELVTNNDEGYQSGNIKIDIEGTIQNIAAYRIGGTYGYDLKQLEFDFMGWMGKSPYRMSDATLSEMGMDYHFTAGTLYDVLVVDYEQVSDAPWGHFEHPEEVVFAGELNTDSQGASNYDYNKAVYDLGKFFGLLSSGDKVNNKELYLK